MQNVAYVPNELSTIKCPIREAQYTRTQDAGLVIACQPANGRWYCAPSGLAWPGLAYAGSLLAVKLIKVHANLNYLTPFAATFGAIDISRQTKKYLRLCLGRFIKKETSKCQATVRDRHNETE